MVRREFLTGLAEGREIKRVPSRQRREFAFSFTEFVLKKLQTFYENAVLHELRAGFLSELSSGNVIPNDTALACSNHIVRYVGRLIA